MPIPVTKYRCQFKCGTKATDSKKKMEEHEEKFCFKNPASKTCATCSNEIYERDSDEWLVWHYRGCKMERMNAFIEAIHDDLVIKNSGKNHVKPIWHCPNHNQNELQPFTEDFITEVTNKIEAKRKEIIEQENMSAL